MSVGGLIESGPLILAMPVAAAAGAITFLSPCVLPLVPGYLSYVTGMSGTDAQRPRARRHGAPGSPGGQASAMAAVSGAAAGSRITPAAASAGPAAIAAAGPARADGSAASPERPGRARTLAGALLFVLGFSVLYMLLGGAFGSLGVTLKAHQELLTRILGVLTIVLGLLFVGVLDRFSLSGRILKPSARPRAGLAGAPLLGFMFGLSWTPCSGPTLSAVLSLGAISGTAARGALLAFVYSLGVGIPFLIVAVAFQRGVRVFGFARRHARLITAIGGVMLVAVGVLEVSGAWSSAMSWLQTHWAASYSEPI
jgi:cytochrome c-type biogenesis protein